MVFLIPVLCLIFLIPLIIKGEFIGEQEQYYSAELIFCWNLVRIRYRKNRPVYLRVSWWDFQLETEKPESKETREKVETPGIKKEKKESQKPDWKRYLDDSFIRRNIRRGRRILKEIFFAFTITGFIKCRYSLTDPALDGEILGYFYSLFYGINPPGLTCDVFPVFGSREPVLNGAARIDIRTRIFRVLYAGTRIFKDVNFIRKEFS